MIRKKFLLLVIISVCALTCLCAGGADAGGATPATPIETTFTLVFAKPPHNEFDFCDPFVPTNPFVHAQGGGLNFSVPGTEKKTGYESTAYIGVKYKFETPGTLSVYCNSAVDNSDQYRLRRVTASADGSHIGLNYIVGVADSTGKTADEARKAADTAVSKITNWDKFDGGLVKPDAVYPVVTIHSKAAQAAGAGTEAHLYSDEGSIIIKMLLRSPKNDKGAYVPYAEGQYKGYIKLTYKAI